MFDWEIARKLLGNYKSTVCVSTVLAYYYIVPFAQIAQHTPAHRVSGGEIERFQSPTLESAQIPI